MTNTHRYLLFFTNQGRAYRLKAYEIPEASRTSRGTAIINILALQPQEKITAVIPLTEDEGYSEQHYLFMATRKGIVKKTPVSEYANLRKNGLMAITLRDGDELIEVKFTDNKQDILLVTKFGMSIRFHETDVRSMGRGAMGVIGMNLMDEDEVVAMQVASQGEYLLVVSEKGIGKLTKIDEFTAQSRGGKGRKCYKITGKTGNVIGAKMVDRDSELMLITTEGIIIRISCSQISVTSRIASGVKLMKVDADNDNVTVASVAKVRETEEKEESTESTESVEGAEGIESTEEE